MNKFFRLAACVIAIALPAIASATSTVINFDDLTNGTVITNQYASATFSSVAGYVNYVTTQPEYMGTPPNFLCTGPVGGSIDCAHDTLVNFTNPVDSLTFQALGIDDVGLVAQVDVYVNDAYASTVDVMGNAEGLSPVLVDLTAYSDVTSIRIYNITDGGGIGWDTFSFNSEVTGTPEPASIAMVGFGLLALARKLLRG